VELAGVSAVPLGLAAGLFGAGVLLGVVLTVLAAVLYALEDPPRRAPQ
jgi:hypothetical protein